ncbi:histone deacetylase family protein [Aciditerrimonas ferrireducens]|uniref:histone deacetylase family protein n=1 Tax=Aciditerrimonas ferrireducens TaxID=667306 RepID=UPI0020068E0A|nr:histone deacetylase [Aciditerrimonas ferrireducens]MCK4177504.1 histone deacetylase [Aciditerrimonas ferrireducens]
MLAFVTTARVPHDTGPWHPERPARLAAVQDGLVEAALADAVVPVNPRPASPEELQAVHDAAYLARLARVSAEGGGALDPDTVVGPRSYEAAVLGAGGALALVEALEAGRAEVGLLAARPPGHHATADQAMGFCLINHVAVVAAHLRRRGERVAVVDWDVHHGNGTQAIFWDDPGVLYCSTHQDPLYPGSGGLAETGGPHAPGATVNVPLPPGATGDVVLRAFDEVIGPAVAEFGPTWVLVSAGFDAHRADPLADLQLSAGDFAELGRRVRELAPRPGRLLFVLEGGYDLDALRLSIGATLASALGEPYRPERPTSGGPGAEAVRAAAARHAELASERRPRLIP